MNILITSAGRRSYLIDYFKKEINSGTIHASNSEFSSALVNADKYVISPKIYSNDYIKFIFNYCLKNDINAIISLFDIDLPILARAKPIFEKKNIKVLVSNYDVTQICNDKWKTFIFLKNNKIGSPKTFLKKSDLISAIEEKKIFFPIIIKPRWGMGSIGVYEVNSFEELNVLHSKLLNEIESTYLKYESSQNIFDSVIFQEKIIGQEYGLDIINDLTENYVTTFIKKKLSIRSGETDRAITVENKNLLKISKKISINLNHILILDVDCFITKENQIVVIDMNCRFGGHYPFSHLAGANIPKAIINWIKGKGVDNKLFNITIGVESLKEIKPRIVNTN